MAHEHTPLLPETHTFNSGWIDNINDTMKAKLKNATQIYSTHPGAGFRRVTSAHLPDSVRVYENSRQQRKVFFKRYEEFDDWVAFIGATQKPSRAIFSLITLIGKLTI